MKLSIKNKGASACAYSINILPTAQTTAVLKEGYRNIPDTSWIFPETKEVQIPGNSSKVVELDIKIPKKQNTLIKNIKIVSSRKIPFDLV